jgi:hypothetical protein
MLQFYDGTWEHRAYWGAALIPWGGQYMGALPPVGQWARLQVPASVLNLEGRTLSGMAFTLYDGRATWDFAGKQGSGGNLAPQAIITLASMATTGRPTAMSGASSSDPDGTIVSYAWNYGDGTVASGASVSKTYAAAGTYTVTLTVTDNGGATGTTSRAVIVNGHVRSPLNPYYEPNDCGHVSCASRRLPDETAAPGDLPRHGRSPARRP